MTLHVGIIAPEFPPDVGGVETYSYALAEAVAAAGLRVTVFTRGDRPEQPVPKGCERAGLLRLRRRHDRAVLSRRDVDAWHVTNAAYAWVALEDRRPVVVSVHGNDFLAPYVLVERPDLRRLPALWRCGRAMSRLDRWLGAHRTALSVKRALPRATGILANSRYTEAVLLKYVPACRGRTTVGLVGVETDFLRQELSAPHDHDPDRLVTVSRLSEPRKNIDRVIRALARLRDTHAFTYTIIGDGPDRARLEALTSDLNLADRVRFLGQADRERLRKELLRSGLFILASSVLRRSHEGFGIAYLEANACGTPVLAARSAGAAEAVDEGVSGFFVERPDVDSLTAALHRYLSGEQRFDARACYRHAAQFTWDRVAHAAIPYYSGGQQPGTVIVGGHMLRERGSSVEG